MVQEQSSTAENCQSPELHSLVNLLSSLRAVVVAAFVVLVLFLLQFVATATTSTNVLAKTDSIENHGSFRRRSVCHAEKMRPWLNPKP